MHTVVDLFAGVGGLSYGFQQAGFEILIANEIDPYIAEAYSVNHCKTKMMNSDITKLNIEEVFGFYKGTIDVVIGGPPCQGFSQKGQRRTINDDRNFLFRYFIKVVDFLKPKYFLMENVPNLITSANGLFITEIKQLFADIGYTITYSVLNAADFGVPQYRKRATVLGKLHGIPPELPIGKAKKVTAEAAISDLAFLGSGEGIDPQPYLLPPETDYQKELRAGAALLHNHVATKHSDKALHKLAMIPCGMGKEVLPAAYLTKSIYSGTWSRIIADEPTVTITTRFDTPSSGRFTHYKLDRCLTVREAARIQSFPDDFIFTGPKSSQMKQVGNAVPPKLGKAIAGVIREDMSNSVRRT